MELFKNLNIIAVLKLGAIGLAFLLALMSYNIIRKEQRNNIPNRNILTSAFIFMFFSVILLALIITSDLIHTRSNLSVKLSEGEIQLKELPFSSVSEVNPKKYFINSELGFAFKKPNNEWKEIKTSKGIKGLLQIMNFKGRFNYERAVHQATDNSPFYGMWDGTFYYVFEHSKSKTYVFSTDSSGTKDSEYAVEDYKTQLVNRESIFYLDTTKKYDKERFNKAVVEYQKEIIGFDSAEMRNAFVLKVFPKDSLRKQMRDLTLPAFYSSNDFSMGVKTGIDKLVANQHQILVGMETNLSNMNVNNKITTLQSERWLLFSENEKYFYVFEICYSPQISPSIHIWEDLKDFMGSFTLLTE
jgi:hypothetical protein